MIALTLTSFDRSKIWEEASSSASSASELEQLPTEMCELNDTVFEAPNRTDVASDEILSSDSGAAACK